MEFIRVIHITGKLWGRSKAVHTNISDKKVEISSISFLGFSFYKLKNVKYGILKNLLLEDKEFFIQEAATIQTRVEVKKSEFISILQKRMNQKTEENNNLTRENSELRSAILNLGYSARIVTENINKIDGDYE